VGIIRQFAEQGNGPTRLRAPLAIAHASHALYIAVI
jgi:hypothetical protein